MDERNLLRNCLRKKDGTQWRSVIENVEAYTIDPEFVFRRDEPMISLRRVLAGKLGLQTNQIKFDKVARKLIRISDGTVLAKQSIMTWRATPISED